MCHMMGVGMYQQKFATPAILGGGHISRGKESDKVESAEFKS